jgi:sugar phosphate isomerase/epimerase
LPQLSIRGKFPVAQNQPISALGEFTIMATTWNLSAFADEAGKTIEEQIAALQRARLNRIDVRGLGDYNVSNLPLDLAKDAAEKLKAAGISVGMLGSPLGKIDIVDDFQSDLEALRHIAQIAPIFDCNAVRIFSYYNKTDRSKDEWQAESLKRLGALKDEAKKLGLVLYHENERHIFGDRCPEVLTILRELRDGETFRSIFDFDNYNQSGDDVWQNWQQLKDVTDAFHLKDSTKECQHVPIGQGAGYAREILSDAAKSGWNGPLSLEPHLAHSDAVMATGPSGQANQEFKDMSAADCFQVATEVAKELLNEVSAS